MEEDLQSDLLESHDLSKSPFIRDIEIEDLYLQGRLRKLPGPEVITETLLHISDEGNMTFLFSTSEKHWGVTILLEDCLAQLDALQCKAISMAAFFGRRGSKFNEKKAEKLYNAFYEEGIQVLRQAVPADGSSDWDTLTLTHLSHTQT